MRFFKRHIPYVWLYPPIIFAVICLLPWWELKPFLGERRLLPLATAYANDFEAWPRILFLHLTATFVLSLVAAGVHLGIAVLLTSRTAASPDAFGK